MRRDYELAKQVLSLHCPTSRAKHGQAGSENLPKGLLPTDPAACLCAMTMGDAASHIPISFAQANKVWSDLASRLAIVEMDCEKAMVFCMATLTGACLDASFPETSHTSTRVSDRIGVGSLSIRDS